MAFDPSSYHFRKSARNSFRREYAGGVWILGDVFVKVRWQPPRGLQERAGTDIQGRNVRSGCRQPYVWLRLGFRIVPEREETMTARGRQAVGKL